MTGQKRKHRQAAAFFLSGLLCAASLLGRPAQAAVLEADRLAKKEYTWHVLADKWILAKKFGIPKIQFTDHMKLKKKED